MNRKSIIRPLCLVIAMLFAAGSHAHPLPDATPFDADRKIPQIDVHAYSVSLTQGESITFDDARVKRVWVDEAATIEVSQVEGKIVLTGKQPGKVVVRFFHSHKNVVMNDNAKHGIGLSIDTFIVTVHPKS